LELVPRDGPVDADIGAGVVVGEAADSVAAGGALGIVDAFGHAVAGQLIGHGVHQLEGAALAAHVWDLHGDVGLGVGRRDPVDGAVVVVVRDVVQQDAGFVFLVGGFGGEGDAEGGSDVGNAFLKDHSHGSWFDFEEGTSEVSGFVSAGADL